MKLFIYYFDNYLSFDVFVRVTTPFFQFVEDGFFHIYFKDLPTWNDSQELKKVLIEKIRDIFERRYFNKRFDVSPFDIHVCELYCNESDKNIDIMYSLNPDIYNFLNLRPGSTYQNKKIIFINKEYIFFTDSLKQILYHVPVRYNKAYFIHGKGVKVAG